MSESLLNYVLKNASCTRCLEKVGNIAHLHTCERAAKTDSQWSSAPNRMCYVPSEQADEFPKLWSKERARQRSFDRTSKLRKIPLPPEGILFQLKAQQENRCYYCFNEFDTNSSIFKPHLDHFVSVANGGSNSIFNLVYACARCNREKFGQDGEQFIDKMMPTRLFPRDLREKITKMRESVRKWKEQAFKNM